MADIGICIHEYSKMDGGKNEKSVRSHRINCARRVLEKLNSIGSTAVIIFPGPKKI